MNLEQEQRSCAQCGGPSTNLVCSKECRYARSLAQNAVRRRKTPQGPCSECGIDFHSPGQVGHKKTCSKECSTARVSRLATERNKEKRAADVDETRKCTFCATEFVVPSQSTRTRCSNSCGKRKFGPPKPTQKKGENKEKCQGCGDRLTGRDHSANYCSASCQRATQNARKNKIPDAIPGHCVICDVPVMVGNVPRLTTHTNPRCPEHRGKHRQSNLFERSWHRFSGSCGYCGFAEPRKGFFASDHVIPVSAGGTNHDDNIVLSCHACNHDKGAQTIEEWSQTDYYKEHVQ